jgi:hypothetical protein
MKAPHSLEGDASFRLPPRLRVTLANETCAPDAGARGVGDRLGRRPTPSAHWPSTRRYAHGGIELPRGQRGPSALPGRRPHAASTQATVEQARRLPQHGQGADIQTQGTGHRGSQFFSPPGGASGAEACTFSAAKHPARRVQAIHPRGVAPVQRPAGECHGPCAGGARKSRPGAAAPVPGTLVKFPPVPPSPPSLGEWGNRGTAPAVPYARRAGGGGSEPVNHPRDEP